MFRWIYNADYGALNGLLFQLGAIDKYVPWLNDPFAAMNWVIVADVWHSTPFVVLIMMAAMAGIPGELYEAARIDGASRWQSFWHITLPTLKGAILVVLVVRTVEAFRVFDIIYVLTGGGPANGTLVISYVAYQETFRFFNLGRGAAVSFLISLFVMLVALVYLRLLSDPQGRGDADATIPPGADARAAGHHAHPAGHLPARRVDGHQLGVAPRGAAGHAAALDPGTPGPSQLHGHPAPHERRGAMSRSRSGRRC